MEEELASIRMDVLNKWRTCRQRDEENNPQYQSDIEILK